MSECSDGRKHLTWKQAKKRILAEAAASVPCPICNPDRYAGVALSFHSQ